LDKAWPDLDKGPASFLTLYVMQRNIGLAHLAGLVAFGREYQTALAPQYRAKPLTRAYGNAAFYSARINF
jgi:hypothetical protein